jgi:pimeloyl-ACP methyl ester carboxylesterase
MFNSDILKDVKLFEHGTGPALLLLPGSFGTGAGWRAVTDAFERPYRVITTSLLGYGATAERRLPGNDKMDQQTEVIDGILDRIGQPTHIVGHSFGGLAALAHALEGKHKAASLTLVEATPHHLLRSAGEFDLHASFRSMTHTYFAEFAEGKKDTARHVVDFYGGAGTFDAFPSKVRDYVVKTTPNNVRDWASATTFDPPLSNYRRLATPTMVVRGGNGHPAMMRIAELISASIPGARLETVAGGSHFLPASHPKQIARLIEAHIGTYLM